MHNENRPTCLFCNKPIRGRSDKKFCNDYCRYLFHNNNKAKTDFIVKKVNKVLARNRSIIKGYFNQEEEMLKVKKELLLERGFIFTYFTHQKQNTEGSILYCYYEYALMILKNDYCLLLKIEL